MFAEAEQRRIRWREVAGEGGGRKGGDAREKQEEALQVGNADMTVDRCRRSRVDEASRAEDSRADVERTSRGANRTDTKRG